MVDEIDDMLGMGEEPKPASARDELAKEAFNMIKSRDMVNVIGTSNFNDDNITPTFGRYILHKVFYRPYTLDPYAIYNDRMFCVHLARVNSAMGGRMMELLTEMVGKVASYTPDSWRERLRNVVKE